MLVDGDRYSVGFEVINGHNYVDVYSLGKAASFDKDLSYSVAKHFSDTKSGENQEKNDTRVSYAAGDEDYYWGRKYAWRQYGLVISRNAFDAYLEEIKHPAVNCVTSNPDLGVVGFTENSIAYADTGLEAAMDALIQTAVRVGAGQYFRSPHYSKKFQIRAPSAISDKK